MPQTSKIKRYAAEKIEIMNFSENLTSAGYIIPLESHITYPDKIDVSYEDEDGNITYSGTASLYRQGTTLFADMIIVSKMSDQKKAIRLISNLYPSVVFKIIEAHNNVLLKLQVKDVFLSAAENLDFSIQKLGSRVTMIQSKEELH